MTERIYDVFLSFRGPNTRDQFVIDLYYALQRAGVSAFLDSTSLRIGEYIPSALEVGIRASRIGIPILSKGFAQSRWCLKELCIMVDLPDFPIFPVFYDVSPSDLRNGGELVQDLQRREGEGERSWPTDFIVDCKMKLNYVSRIKGHRSCDFEKSDLIRQIVKDVQNKLSQDTPKVKDIQGSLGKSPLVHLDTPTCFGFEWQVDHLLKLLRLGNPQQKVVKVGIHGMSGIGKTTLASLLCKQILLNNSHHFNVVCIVRDVHQRSKAHGLVKMQQSMLHYLDGSESQVDYVQQGKSLIEKSLRERNTLLLLDEIETFEQLEALGGCFTHFGEGSRLLITTTDRQILNVANIDEQYEVPKLAHEHALRLFTSHVFPNSSSPDQHLQTACNEIVRACEGLPVALQILGKELVGQRDKNVWASWIQKLRRHNGLQSKLEICYYSLDEEEKEMFQDIACFFAWTEKKTAVIFWEELKYSALASLEHLSQKHMISLGSHGELLMHPCLRDLGRVLARQTPSEPTRVFGDSDPEDVFRGFVEKTKTRYIWYEPKEEDTLNAEWLKSLTQLQLLWLSDVVIEGNFADIHLRRLIWLRWRRYSSECLPPGMNLSKLAILQVTESRITHLWDDQSQNQQIRPRRLKVLVLSGCPLLESLPNGLNYEFLQILDLQNSESLKTLPNMTAFKSLVSLNMEGCGVFSLPEDFGELSSLKELNLSRCKNLSKLPFHFGNLSKLEKLQIAHNPKLTKLPETIGHLKALEYLDAGYCQLDEDGLPEGISELITLRVMNLEHNRFSRLPVGLKKLSQLSELYLDGCTELVVLPELPPSLKSLNIRHCRFLSGVITVWDLKELIRVDATMSEKLLGFNGLESLQGLITLNLMGCKSIPTSSLERSLRGLRSLESLFMGGPGITTSQLHIWYDSITKAISEPCDLLCSAHNPSSSWRSAKVNGQKGEEKLCMEEQNEVLYCAGYIVCSAVFMDDEGDSDWERSKRLQYSIERGETQSQVIHPGMRMEGGLLELRIVRTEEDSNFEWLQMGSKVRVKATSDYDQWKAYFKFSLHQPLSSTSCNSAETTVPTSITIYGPSKFSANNDP